MYSVILSEKFQICIPKALREELNLHAGQQLILIAKGLVIHLVPKIEIKNVRGLLKGASPSHYRDRQDRV